MKVADALKLPRVAIAGGPRTGKTTLAGKAHRARTADGHGQPSVLIHTDDYIGLPWVDVPHFAILQCEKAERFVIEGVQVARCLRKGLKVDAVIWLEAERAPRTKQQESMAKGVKTVFMEWVALTTGTPVVTESAL